MLFFSRIFMDLACFPSQKAILDFCHHRDGFWDKRIDPEDGGSYTFEEMMAYVRNDDVASTPP